MAEQCWRRLGLTVTIGSRRLVQEELHSGLTERSFLSMEALNRAHIAYLHAPSISTRSRGTRFRSRGVGNLPSIGGTYLNIGWMARKTDHAGLASSTTQNHRLQQSILHTHINQSSLPLPLPLMSFNPTTSVQASPASPTYPPLRLPHIPPLALLIFTERKPAPQILQPTIPYLSLPLPPSIHLRPPRPSATCTPNPST